MKDPADKSAYEILAETGIYDVYGPYRTSPHDADKLRRFESGLNVMIAREGFEESELVSELRQLLTDRIIELEMDENWNFK